jgi:DinB superfamily
LHLKHTGLGLDFDGREFMTDAIGRILTGRIRWTHQSIIEVTEELTDAQLAQQPSPTAPPIGWHVFHMARWADRLQASFPRASVGQGRQADPRNQIWTATDLATQWGLRPERLGSLEAGTGMDIDSAVAVASLGKATLLAYARETFAEAEQAIGEPTVAQLEQSRLSVLPQLHSSPTRQPYFSGDRDVTLLDDLIYHISHANRHLGMIEALRGALFTIAGTSSV